MLNLNFFKILSAFSISLSCMAFSAIAMAAPSAIDSALNNSLQETKELSVSISDTLESQKASEESRKAMVKNRKVVQLNLEDADTEKSTAQPAEPNEKSQANSEIIESSY